MNSLFKFLRFEEIDFVVEEHNEENIVCVIKGKLNNRIMTSIAKYYDYTIEVNQNKLILNLKRK